MQPDSTDKNLQALLILYHQEKERLKAKLLNGEFWKNMKPVRRNSIELVIAIHKSHNYIVPDRTASANPQNFINRESSGQQPVE